MTDATPVANTARPTEMVELDTPIMRGTTRIDTITVRKPYTSDLRGLKSPEIIQGDVDAAIKLLPRITEPMLTPLEVANLEPEDLLSFQNVVASFLLTRKMKEALET